MSDERDLDAARAQYKRAKVEFVPVRSGRGIVVHATSLRGANQTVCDRRFKSLKVVAHPLDCVDCMLAVGLDARPRKPAKRRKRKR